MSLLYFYNNKRNAVSEQYSVSNALASKKSGIMREKCDLTFASGAYISVIHIHEVGREKHKVEAVRNDFVPRALDFVLTILEVPQLRLTFAPSSFLKEAVKR